MVDSDVSGQSSTPKVDMESLKKMRQGMYATVSHWSSAASMDEVDKQTDALILDSMVENVMDFKARLESVHVALMPYVSDAEVGNVVSRYASYVQKLHLYLLKIKKRRSAVAPPAASSSLSVALPSSSTSTPSSHLMDRLPVPKFDGDVLKFQEFWDVFDMRVHTNSSLHKVDKFHYLLQALEGPALKCLASLPKTEANYDEAIAILTKRFKRRSAVINAHVAGILKVNLSEASADGDVAVFRNAVDDVVAHVRSLRALDVLKDGSTTDSNIVLGAILFFSCPLEIRSRWCSAKGDKDIEVNELVEFLEEQVRARENCVVSGFPDHSSKPEKSSSTSHSRPTHRPARSKGWKSSGESTVAAFHSGKKELPGCPFCDDDHHGSKCTKISGWSVKKIRDAVMRSGRCYRCLNVGHGIGECRSKTACSHCDKLSHHRLLCFAHEKSEKKEEIVGGLHAITHQMSPRPRVLLRTVPALLEDRKVRVLLDNGSEASFIENQLAETLKLPVEGKQKIRLDVLGGSQVQRSPSVAKIYRLTLKKVSDPRRFVTVRAYGIDQINSKDQRRPTTAELSGYPHLSDIVFADSVTPGVPAKIQVLLGADFCDDLVEGNTIRGKPGEPIAVPTTLGWVVSGPFSDSVADGLSCNHVQLDELMSDFFAIEDVGGGGPLVEDSVLNSFESSIETTDERYKVRLPWKDDHPLLSSNLNMARRRLNGLLNRFEKSPDLKEMYNNAIGEFENRGFIECVGEPVDGGSVHYLPHHPVVRQSSKTTKCRPVFEGNAKGYNQVSLNDCLHVGPSLIPDIPDLLLRFRAYCVAASGDIEKAFLQVELHEDDRDFCRFLWVKDAQTVAYRFRVVSFGLTCSPFLLNATIRYHLSQSALLASFDPGLLEEMKMNFYVDNLFVGSTDSESTYKKVVDATHVMSKAGMKLCQWSSNDPDLNRRLVDDGVQVESDRVVKVLGLQWDTESDTLHLPAVPPAKPDVVVTKRVILSFVAKVWDPLGFASPLGVQGKVLMQKIHLLSTGWDVPVTDPILLDEFQQFLSSSESLSSIAIPRNCSGEVFDLHVFCDASRLASAACCYVRFALGDQFKVSLVLAKTKIAPPGATEPGNRMTVPRLELLACSIGSALLVRVRNALSLGSSVPAYLWSDSMIALCWIRNPPKSERWVSNRVRVIREVENMQWFHVPTNENPADLPSRGEFKTSLSGTLWFNGPDWLSNS